MILYLQYIKQLKLLPEKYVVGLLDGFVDGLTVGKDGERDGRGKLTEANGKVVRGLWKGGYLIKETWW